MRKYLIGDKYQIKANIYLSPTNYQALFLLYQPLVGYQAINLFLSLYYDLPPRTLLNKPNILARILKNTGFTLKEFTTSLKQLEAIGLVRTYVNNDYYLFVLCSPLEPENFYKNRILKELLYTNLGENDYWSTTAYFKVEPINHKDFKEITLKFNDVFSLENIGKHDEIKMKLNLQSSNYNNLDDQYDIELIKEELDKYSISLSRKDWKLIKQLGILYQINNLDMVDLINQSWVSGKLDNDLFISKCRAYIRLIDPSEIKKIYTKQAIKDRRASGEDSLNLHIKYLEETSPRDLLVDKQGGKNPTAHDLKNIEKIMTSLDLNPGVMNVLIELTLAYCDNKLPLAYMEAVAGVWKRNKITNVVDALNSAKKYIHKQKEKAPISLNNEPVKNGSDEIDIDEIDIDEIDIDIVNIMKGLE